MATCGQRKISETPSLIVSQRSTPGGPQVSIRASAFAATNAKSRRGWRKTIWNETLRPIPFMTMGWLLDQPVQARMRKT
jgi:hypothetical protein